MPGETYFFENPDTGKPVIQVDGAWRTAKTRAGIKGRLRIHDLSDTFATLALRGGVDIRTVAELIGDSPEIALKSYCHCDERTKRQAVDRLSELVLGSRQILHEAAQRRPGTGFRISQLKITTRTSNPVWGYRRPGWVRLPHLPATPLGCYRSRMIIFASGCRRGAYPKKCTISLRMFE